jgi:hypothetical protein
MAGMANDIWLAGAFTVGLVLMAFLTLRPTLSVRRFRIRLVRVGLVTVVVIGFWAHVLTHLF